jgi:PTH1 family peptidyl-tRNA hydrolase
MLLIIGLGNPGKKYEKNRHNTGFIILEELRKLWDFPDFSLDKKFNAEISEKINPLLPLGEGAPFNPPLPAGEGWGEGNKILIARPQTFMNNSGEAVKKIMDFYKLTPEDLIVIHDDLDINLGEFRIAADSSSAGHKGIEDIIEKLGTQEFKRIRIGIEGEEKRKDRKMPGDEFVLQNFSEEEYNQIKSLAPEIAKNIM